MLSLVLLVVQVVLLVLRMVLLLLLVCLLNSPLPVLAHGDVLLVRVPGILTVGVLTSVQVVAAVQLDLYGRTNWRRKSSSLVLPRTLHELVAVISATLEDLLGTGQLQVPLSDVVLFNKKLFPRLVLLHLQVVLRNVPRRFDLSASSILVSV